MHIMSANDGEKFLNEYMKPAPSERISLSAGLQRMFNDGFAALESNSDIDGAVRSAAKADLTREQSVCNCNGLFLVVNGDAWSNRIDGELGRPFAKSVDMLIPVDDEGSHEILLAEGKLGLAPREKRSRLRNPSYIDMVEKYHETKSKLCRSRQVSVCRIMNLIVPFAVREVARSTFERRNKAGGECRIIPVDVIGFIERIGAMCPTETKYDVTSPRHGMELLNEQRRNG